MGDYFQSTNINAGKYYLNGKPLTSGGVPHTMLPVGSIIMWNGTQSNIPSGWHLCNGENNTPNLSGRFVISVGTFTQNGTSYHKSPGDKGGDFKIKNENLPEHVHGISPNYLFNGTTSSIYAVTGPSSLPPLAFSGSPSTQKNVTSNEPYYPPYYALCYIMFTGQ